MFVQLLRQRNNLQGLPKHYIEALLQFKISQRADVRIYTVAGELVRTTDVNKGWDGRNDAGELVASGVYIYYLLGEDRSQHTGKIFVLRK